MSNLPSEFQEYLLRKGEGRRLRASAFGDVAILKCTEDQTDGRVAFLEYESAPGFNGPPPHTHDGHEELFYVTSGQLNMLVGDKRVICGPGDFAFAPRNVPHTFWNEGSEVATFVAVFSPAGFEAIFEHENANLIAGLELSEAEEIELAARFDMRIVPWPI